MGERARQRVSAADVRAHDAASAWKEFAGGACRIRGIACLTERRKKTKVYRIELDAAPRRTVVAKWKLQRDRREIEMYTRVLPQAGLAAPGVYGELVPRGKDAGSWLFMEDLGDAEPSLSGPDDRRLVSRWLATLHQLEVPGTLSDEDRGSGGYLRMICSLQQAVCDNIDRPWVTRARRVMFSRMLRVLGRLERNWTRVDAVCRLAPSTVVHGDLVRKNVRVRSTGRVRELVVLDWEMAGVGVPSIDFSSIPCDLPHYVEGVRHVWPGVSLATVEQLVRVGRVFRSLGALEWAAVALPHDWSSVVSFEDPERRLRESVRGVATADWI